MNKDLQSYIKIYNVIEPDICKQTIKELQLHKNWQQHEYYNVNQNTSGPKSGNQELSVTYEDFSHNTYFMDKIWHSLQKYYEELNFSWFGSWQGFTPVRFNRYEKNKKMAEHCDHIVTVFDGNRRGIPTLSVLGLLNDDYEGGKFVMFGDTEIKMKAGDIIIFPSIFLYPHRVDPVTKGTRYSFISWVW